jgi:hypothetical protein
VLFRKEVCEAFVAEESKYLKVHTVINPFVFELMPDANAIALT